MKYPLAYKDYCNTTNSEYIDLAKFNIWVKRFGINLLIIDKCGITTDFSYVIDNNGVPKEYTGFKYYPDMMDDLVTTVFEIIEQILKTFFALQLDCSRLLGGR